MAEQPDSRRRRTPRGADDDGARPERRSRRRSSEDVGRAPRRRKRGDEATVGEDRPRQDSRPRQDDRPRSDRRRRDDRRRQERPNDDRARQDDSREDRPRSERKRPDGKRGRRRRTSTVPPEVRARTRKVGSIRFVGVVASGVVLVSCAIVGLLFFARPTTSEVERRTLTTFPAFTLDGFLNGSFFSDVALWYSDTYPLREQMVAANQAIDGLHGVKTETQMVGGAKQADELPPEGSSGDASSSKETEAKKEEKKESVAERVERGNVEVPDAKAMAEAVQNQVLDGLYVKGDAAYNIYYFSQDSVQEYADMLTYLSEHVDKDVTVYSVVVPNASGVLLSDKEVKDLGGTNQVDAIKYLYSLLGEKVKDVDSVSELKKHTDDYIYFRTDHHWTHLGAYYSYVAFCNRKGIDPVPLDDHKHENYGDFLGSFYAQLQNADMSKHPDSVDAWLPIGTNDMTVWTDGGGETEYKVITDTSDWDVSGKSMAFIMGDQPLEHVKNPKIDDGSSCLLVKDSYGCYFAPWLVDSYEDVWIADFRYFNQSFSSLIKDKGIKDVIILNNVSLAGGGVVAPSILGKW